MQKRVTRQFLSWAKPRGCWWDSQ